CLTSLPQTPLSSFLLPAAAAPQNRHSFPTRRSSDLMHMAAKISLLLLVQNAPYRDSIPGTLVRFEMMPVPGDISNRTSVPGIERSEEHTSELQSLAYLVCRLLLEQKKQ